jgi:short-subunit dehydrogenase
MSSYSATKAAVVALSETLRLELRKDHIGCSVVCPGFFKTNLTETSRGTNPRVAKLFDGLVNRSRRSADEIARLVAEGVAQRKFHILTHADSKVVWFLKRTLPYPVYGWIVARGTRRWQG